MYSEKSIKQKSNKITETLRPNTPWQPFNRNSSSPTTKKYLPHHKNIPQNQLYISGGINKPKQPKSVIGLFRRESSGSRGGVGGSILTVDGTDGTSARGSDPSLAAALSQMVVVPSMPYNPRLDKRSQSISSGSGSAGIGDSGHAGPFPVTASHRRNVRRGSMLELSG